MTDSINPSARPVPATSTTSAASAASGPARSAASASPDALRGSSLSRGAPRSWGEESVALSAAAQQSLDQADVRQAKVEAIQAALRAGHYPLDSRRMAESFVALERLIRE